MLTDFLANFSVNALYGFVLYIVVMVSVFTVVIVLNEAYKRVFGQPGDNAASGTSDSDDGADGDAADKPKAE